MTLTPQAFVAKWRNNTSKERSAAQEHFIDLCRMLGHPTPNEVSDGSLVFEAGVAKSGGGQGFADVFKRGVFAWEYKGPKGNLDAAYQQILKYREALNNPPLLIVSDIQTIIIHTNFTNTVKRRFDLTLDDLLTPAGLDTLRWAFTDPERLKATQTTEQATQEVAKEFARLAEILRRDKHDPARIAHFLIRLLFALFAEDAGLLPAGLLKKLLTATRRSATLLSNELRTLFQAMSSGGVYALEAIPHFNGSLYDSDDVLDLGSEAVEILLRVSEKDWSSIEPAILGTLFERSLDPSKRSQLGAHYTSRDDIQLIVEPVLMAPLRRRWAEIEAQAHALAAKRDAAEGGQRTRLTNELTKLLQGWVAELSAVRVLDPACGSGNFLYVALKALLDLEKQAGTLASALLGGAFFPLVGPEQLLGIEVNEYAHELARITVWIGYIQWLRENGYGQPSEPILRPLETIQRKDAVLAFDDQGQPVEPDWPEATVIIGNPPFLGGKRLRTELGNATVEALFQCYEGRVPKEADLVTYWFEKARAMIEQGKAQRAGLIATNSIRGGANRIVLERIKASGDMFMAWSDREWVQDGAAVRVSMVGFDAGNEQQRYLDGVTVPAISPDLTGDIDITKAKRLHENSNISFMGTTKVGQFELTPQQASVMLQAPLNPNGRPNSDVVVPWVNGLDVTRRNRGMYIIDFGVDMPESEAALYELPFAFLETHVKAKRMENNQAAYRRLWWLHAASRSGMRKAIQGLKRYIATPRLAKYRLFVFLSVDVLPDSQIIAIARDDDYFFGVLHSRYHEVWSLRMGTSLEDRPRYTPTTTFETYPFPWPPGQEPVGDPTVVAIAEAAKRLVELRDNWLNPAGADAATLKARTLTNLYNLRPTWLRNAHAALDAAVAAAYGWPVDLSEEEILRRLLELNLSR